MSEESPTIKVCVRVRPFIKEELSGARGDGQDGPCEVCVSMPTKTRVEITRERETRGFEFDRCFWSHDAEHPLYATQETLQIELGESMIQSAMNGFNNCIFAYGQTGSGKSFSVLGGPGEHRGLLPRVVEGLFDHFSQCPEGVVCKTLVAFIEIYNESIKDLLAPRDLVSAEKDKKLEVKQHPVLGTFIPGLVEAPVLNSKEVLDLVEYGTAMRHVSATAMNATSSRSHCIFTFKTSVQDPSGQAKLSQTHLVDLAGSERTKRTKASGDRLKEGAAINKSLSTLARVISALASKKKDTNPPFRDSKLTYILKESLCGNSKTVMMAAISPSKWDFEETLSTLKFAQSVKQVQTHAVQNQVHEKGLEAQLRSELEKLRQQLQECEAEKSSDAQRLTQAQKRIEEQEILCARWGGDWQTLVAAEKKRNVHRQAIRRVSQDPNSLEELRKIHELAQAVQAQKEREGHSSSSSSSSSSDFEEWSGGSSSSGSSRHRRKDDALVLMHFGEEQEEDGSDDDDEDRPQRSKEQSAVALKGLVTKTRRNGKEGEDPAKRADLLSRQYRQLKAEVEKLERDLNAHAGPGVAKLQLRAMVVVDTKQGEADVIVRATSQGPHHIEEWLSWTDFRKRVAWINEEWIRAKRSAISRNSLAGYPAGAGVPQAPLELWAASAVATSSGRADAEAELRALRAALAKSQAELRKYRPAGENEIDNRESNADLEANGHLGGLHGGKSQSWRLATSVASSFHDAISALDAAQAVLEGAPCDRRNPLGPHKRRRPPRNQPEVC